MEIFKSVRYESLKEVPCYNPVSICHFCSKNDHCIDNSTKLGVFKGNCDFSDCEPFYKVHKELYNFAKDFMRYYPVVISIRFSWEDCGNKGELQRIEHEVNLLVNEEGFEIKFFFINELDTKFKLGSVIVSKKEVPTDKPSYRKSLKDRLQQVCFNLEIILKY